MKADQTFSQLETILLHKCSLELLASVQTQSANIAMMRFPISLQSHRLNVFLLGQIGLVPCTEAVELTKLYFITTFKPWKLPKIVINQPPAHMESDL